jgi:hypothetical protein
MCYVMRMSFVSCSELHVNGSAVVAEVCKCPVSDRIYAIS